jgi:hypothetical protein
MGAFPKTLPRVHGRYKRRRIGNKLSVTAILDGNKHSGLAGRYGLYLWNGDEWELDAEYASRAAANKAAARIRKALPSSSAGSSSDPFGRV